MNKFVGHYVILRNGKVTDTKVEIGDGDYPLCAMVNHKKYKWTRNGTYYHVLGQSEYDIVDIYTEWIPLTDPNHILRPEIDYASPKGTRQWKPVVNIGYARTIKEFPLYDFAYKATPTPIVHCGGPYVAREAYDRVVKELAELKRNIADLLT